MKLLLVHFVLIASGLALLATDAPASINASKPAIIAPQVLTQQPLSSDSHGAQNLKITEASSAEKDRGLAQSPRKGESVEVEGSVDVNQGYSESSYQNEIANNPSADGTEAYAEDNSDPRPDAGDLGQSENNYEENYVEEEVPQSQNESEQQNGEVVEEYVEPYTHDSETLDAGVDNNSAHNSQDEYYEEVVEEPEAGGHDQVNDYEEPYEEYVEDDSQGQEGSEEAENEYYEEEPGAYVEDHHSGLSGLISALKASSHENGYHLSTELGDSVIHFLQAIEHAEANLNTGGSNYEEAVYEDEPYDYSKSYSEEEEPAYNDEYAEDYNEDEDEYARLNNEHEEEHEEEHDGEHEGEYDEEHEGEYDEENDDYNGYYSNEDDNYGSDYKKGKRKRIIRRRRHMIVRPGRNLRAPNNVHYHHVARVPLKRSLNVRRPLSTNHKLMAHRRPIMAHHRRVVPLVKRRILRHLNRFQMHPHSKFIRHLNVDGEVVGNLTRISKFIGTIDKVSATYKNAFSLLPEPVITNGLSESDHIASEMTTYAKLRGFGVFFLKNYQSLHDDLQALQGGFSEVQGTIDSMLFYLNRNKNYPTLIATKEAASPEFVKRQELLSKLSQEYALKMFEASQMIEFLISSNSNIAHHVWPLTHQPDPANGDCVVDAQTLSTISILLPYLNSNKNSIEVSVADIKTRLDDVESLVPKVDEVLGNMGLIVQGKSVESESFIKNAGIWSITCALTALLISMVL